MGKCREDQEGPQGQLAQEHHMDLGVQVLLGGLAPLEGQGGQGGQGGLGALEFQNHQPSEDLSIQTEAL